MREPENTTLPELERFRELLLLLSRLRLDRRLQGKIDPSDLVQETLLRAHQSLGHLRGQEDAVVAAWLRQILAATMADEVRRYSAGKRNIAVERVLLAALDESSACLEAWLASDQTSPSKHALKNEQLRLLADALAAMSDDQRHAVELHHLKGQPLAEVSRRMGRSKASVAGLLRRGLKELRNRMQSETQDSR
jgi:RNA polymerase sigma-70 factor (ECF subfamily)